MAREAASIDNLSPLEPQDQGFESRLHPSRSTKSSLLLGLSALPLDRKNPRNEGTVPGLETSLPVYCKQLCLGQDHGMCVRGR